MKRTEQKFIASTLKQQNMTSVKIKFRPSSVDKTRGTVYYQVIHNRVVRQIRTNYRIHADEWDSNTSSVVIPINIDTLRKNFLLSVFEHLRQDTERIEGIISRLELQNEAFSADELVSEFHAQQECTSVFKFMQGVILQLRSLGRIRTSETYMATLSSLRKFCGNDDLPLEGINCNLMVRYEAWLKSNGSCPNTTSFYMRIIRAVYNRAVDEGIIMQAYPFKNVYTGVAKTVKRAVPLDTLRRMKALDLAGKPHLAYARDMFFFSFYTRGMSFIDMSYLKKTDINDGVLVYRRRKTNQQLAIKWEDCMDGIVSLYDNKGSKYVLPIIVDEGKDERNQVKNSLCRINRALKEISKMVKSNIPLTMYCARHSWASIARSKNVPVSIISESLGHTSEKITQIYFSSLDANMVDKANELVINAL